MLEETLIPSAVLGRNRTVWLDVPDVGTFNRLLVVLDAENYLCNVGIGSILVREEEREGLTRMITLYVPFVTPENRHAEYACDPLYERFLVDELLGWAYLRFPSLERGGHAMVGLSLSGLQAIWTALRNPGVFSAVISQSPSAWYRDECLLQEIDPRANPKTAFRISVGSKETSFGVVHQPGDLHQKASQVESCGRLVEGLRQAGHEIEHSIFEGDHDSDYWAAEMPEALRWLRARIR